jgi:hypothetical protein
VAVRVMRWAEANYNHRAALKTTCMSVSKQSTDLVNSLLRCHAEFLYVLIIGIVLPARLNAKGKLSTPPPRTVLTRLTTAELTLPFRRLLSKRGTRNSKLAVRARIISSAALECTLRSQRHHTHVRADTEPGKLHYTSFIMLCAFPIKVCSKLACIKPPARCRQHALSPSPGGEKKKGSTWCTFRSLCTQVC